MARIVKGVSFNTADPIESELLKQAETKGQFSSYVKKLIQTDVIQQIQIITKESFTNPQPITIKTFNPIPDPVKLPVKEIKKAFPKKEHRPDGLL